MGMDAKAYLWFGTSQLNSLPESLKLEGYSEDMDRYKAVELIELIEKKLEGTSVSLVHIPSEGDDGYAMAVRSTSKEHDWDCAPCDPFDIEQPTTAQKLELVEACRELGWPVDPLLGWRLGATYW